jgi:predicted PurR-regulated permease PerM
VIVGTTIAENSDRVAAFVQKLMDEGPPPPPDWVSRLPLIGNVTAEYWSGFSHDTARLMSELAKYVEPARKVLVASGVTLVNGLLQLLLSILLAFFFYRDGDAVVARLGVAIDRIAGERGRRLAGIAVLTVRGVVLGILGTALVQGVLVAIAVALAGIKSAPLLGFIAFLLSPAPGGPAIVWLPASLWLFNQGQTGWGIFVLLWGLLVVSTIDNFIRPMFISRGADLPFVLVLLGVLGGAIAFGFVGVFLGPVLIAVGYALLKEWAVGTAPEADDNGVTDTAGPPTPTEADTTDPA